MRQSSREVLELIQDCESAEEARLLLQACGWRLNKAGFGFDRDGYYFEVSCDSFFYAHEGGLRWVRYGAIRDLLATLEAA